MWRRSANSLSASLRAAFAPRIDGCAQRSLATGLSRTQWPRRSLAALPPAAAAVAAALLRPTCRAAAASAEEVPWTTTPSGLQYRELVVGEGELPVKGQTVHVHYTGSLENGKVFDSSIPRGAPLEFPVGSGKVIAGWDEGILTMRVGGKRQLKIPPKLGYGRQGVGPIPANATLLFECELVSLGAKPFLSRIFG
ncbi:unnamed protein product [Polarella glacialis]|uniref:peptidylprolyl isomerase n=1 Tax=Polarella glacialis TaxID=89957 RepID=A0A813HH41_POLGL|nr:unnamed protein product [Polarella glacialis]CAE8685167.1 unnamed protein product [Polarella glacialis]